MSAAQQAEFDLLADFDDVEPVMRKRNRRTEDKLHVSIWRDLQKVLHPGVVAYSLENRHVGAVEGSMRRERGVKAGIPDMIFHWPHGWCAYIEIKPPKCYPTRSQKHMHELLRTAGIAVGVCHSISEVLIFLRDQGCPLRINRW